MKAFFSKLFKYNHQVNEEFIRVISENRQKIGNRPLKLFSHILNAHHIWNERIEGRIPQFEPWHKHDLDDLQNMDKANYEQSLVLISKHDPVQKIEYLNTKNETFTNSVIEILFHIINHSTYHRGQLVDQMKSIDIEPIASDFIFFQR